MKSVISSMCFINFILISHSLIIKKDWSDTKAIAKFSKMAHTAVENSLSDASNLRNFPMKKV